MSGYDDQAGADPENDTETVVNRNPDIDVDSGIANANTNEKYSAECRRVGKSQQPGI